MLCRMCASAVRVEKKTTEAYTQLLFQVDFPTGKMLSRAWRRIFSTCTTMGSTRLGFSLDSERYIELLTDWASPIQKLRELRIKYIASLEIMELVHEESQSTVQLYLCHTQNRHAKIRMDRAIVWNICTVSGSD